MLCLRVCIPVRIEYISYRCVLKLWTHWTKVYCFCDTSVREKAWRSRKHVAQAT